MATDVMKFHWFKWAILSMMLILTAANIGHAAFADANKSLLGVINEQGRIAREKPLPLNEINAKVATLNNMRRYKQGELLVKFKHDTKEVSKDNLHEKHGGVRIKEFPALRIHHVRLKKGLDEYEAIRLYKMDPTVEYVEPNYAVSIQDITTDPRINELWGLNNIGQTGGAAGADIDAPEAWGITRGSAGVVVAVIDTGIDYNHPDLASNMWVNTGEIPGNGIDDDRNGYVDDVYGINAITHDGNAMDDNGHGTHVAGTIGASGNNGIGVAGVNWNVRIIACKFLDANGSGWVSGAVECLQYIHSLTANGVNIVASNNSWGGGDYSQALHDAIDAQRDCLFIAAAGNNNNNNDLSETYPATYDLPNLIAVAATDHTDTKPGFSNYGRRTVHVGAPGVAILSTLPVENAFGLSGGYGLLSGTSMATPHVTGLAALLKSQEMGRDWREIKNLIMSGGDTIPAMTGTTISGKRINAFGSLNCSDARLFSLIEVPKTLAPGVPVKFSVLSINCGSPAGPVLATTAAGGTILLHDDGIDPDPVAGDGIFSALWTPAREGELLTFASTAGDETISVPPLIIPNILLEGNIHAPYRSLVEIRGGLPPHTCTMTAGSLPPGLTFNSVTREISGTPTKTGTYSFAVQAVDSLGAILSTVLEIRVVDDLVAERMVRTYDDRGGDDYGQFVAVLENGDFYVAGRSSVGTNWDFLVVKFDKDGNKIWSRTYDQGPVDFPYGIVADRDGNVYVVGTYDIDSYTRTRIIKYSPSGEFLWIRNTHYNEWQVFGLGIAIDPDSNIYISGGKATLKYDRDGNFLARIPYGRQVTVDSSSYDVATDRFGNVYVTGMAWGDESTGGCLTEKYDSAGNLLWSRINEAGSWAYNIAVDTNGNVAVTGDPKTLKYDSSGNLLWVKVNENMMYGVALGIVFDDKGNLYLTGAQSSNHKLDSIIKKYDPAGNLLWVKTPHRNEDEEFIGISVDSRGTIHTAGIVFSETGSDFLINVYSQFLISNTALPDGQAGVPYSQALSASGGISPLSWSIPPGSLPAGLSLDSASGLISGVTNAVGEYSFTARVTDASGAFLERVFTLTFYDRLTITTLALPDAQYANAYRQTLAVTASALPYAWSVADGSLPGGLLLSPAGGEIVGTPLETGIFPFRVQVCDGNSTCAVRDFTLTVGIGITTASLPPGPLGIPYSQFLTSGGGVAPYAWEISAGSLPGGLSLNQDTGEISGVPTTVGRFEFTIRVTDEFASAATRQLSITISNIVISTVSLPQGGVGIYYNQTLTASGGNPPFAWSLVSGSLPDGMTFDDATGTISGIPSAMGSFPLTFQVRDEEQSLGVTSLTLLVSALTHTYVTDVAYAQGMAVDRNGFMYVCAQQSGGWGRYLTIKYDPLGNVVWTRSYSGGNPTGIAVDAWGNVYVLGSLHTTNNDLLLIKYDQAGNMAWTRTYDSGGEDSIGKVAIDGKGNVYVTSSTYATKYISRIIKYDPEGNLLWSTLFDGYLKAIAVDVFDNSYLAGNGDNSYLTIKLDPAGSLLWTRSYYGEGMSKSAYGLAIDGSGNIVVTGNSTDGSVNVQHILSLKYDSMGTLLWVREYGSNISASSLAIDDEGRSYIAGTLYNSGDSDYVALAYDSAGALLWTNTYEGGPSAIATGIATSKDGRIVYVTGMSASGMIVKYFPPQVDTGSVPPGINGASYSSLLKVSGGTPPYAWSLISGALPGGICLDGSTGEISGVPSGAGTINDFSVQIKDANGLASVKKFSLAVFGITTSLLNTGAVGTPYNHSLKGAGGTPPYTWAISGGFLPYGLALSANTGEIYGTPTTAGSFPFVVQMRDSKLQTVTKMLSIIIDTMTVTTTALPRATVGSQYIQALTVAGGVAPRTWSIASGNLPPGLSLNPSTGDVSGTPWTSGSFSFTVRVTDSSAKIAEKPLSMTVDSMLCSKARLHIARDPSPYYSYYSLVLNAYENLQTWDVLQIQDADFAENLVFDRDVPFILKGGYDCDFTENTLYTTVHGSLTFAGGTVIVDRLIVR